jgi:hypothetical protein
MVFRRYVHIGAESISFFSTPLNRITSRRGSLQNSNYFSSMDLA